MGRSWCADRPVVTPTRSSVPTPVTLIVPYYECPVFFARQLAHWATLPAAWGLRIIVVDDGSPTMPAAPMLTAAAPAIRLFRIEHDVRWNWLAARNIGAHHAADGWLVLTDMDHMIPRETFEALVFGVRRVDTIYGFARQEHSGLPLKPHKNSWCLTKSMFWRVGGYDETLSGYYGTDGDWRRRCAHTAPMAILSTPIVRYEFVADSSTTRYLRKQPEDVAVQHIVAKRGASWRPKTLSFPYQEVTAVPA